MVCVDLFTFSFATPDARLYCALPTVVKIVLNYLSVHCTTGALLNVCTSEFVLQLYRKETLASEQVDLISHKYSTVH